MSRNIIETVMGAVVLVVAGGFLAFAYNSSKMKSVNGYFVNAKFSNISGISLGSDVRIGGIKIGVVSHLKLDPETYAAWAKLEIKPDVKIPEDSSAAIVSDGLLGSKYVAIEPGAEEAMLKNGGDIEYTQSSVNIEEMIGKFVFSGGGVDNDSDKPKPDAAPKAIPSLEEPGEEPPSP